eukprot:g4922.t1
MGEDGARANATSVGAPSAAATGGKKSKSKAAPDERASAGKEDKGAKPGEPAKKRGAEVEPSRDDGLAGELHQSARSTLEKLWSGAIAPPGEFGPATEFPYAYVGPVAEIPLKSRERVRLQFNDPGGKLPDGSALETAALAQRFASAVAMLFDSGLPEPCAQFVGLLPSLGSEGNEQQRAPASEGNGQQRAPAGCSGDSVGLARHGDAQDPAPPRSGCLPRPRLEGPYPDQLGYEALDGGLEDLASDASAAVEPEQAKRRRLSDSLRVEGVRSVSGLVSVGDSLDGGAFGCNLAKAHTRRKVRAIIQGLKGGRLRVRSGLITDAPTVVLQSSLRTMISVGVQKGRGHSHKMSDIPAAFLHLRGSPAQGRACVLFSARASQPWRRAIS